MAFSEADFTLQYKQAIKFSEYYSRAGSSYTAIVNVPR